MTTDGFDRIAANRETATLDAIHTPMMVRFRDINDPTSVELVDPEHLDASFGPGVKFSKATIAVTGDAVTIGIEQVLPWLDKLSDRSLGGTYLQPIENFSETLNVSNFRRGFK